MYAITFLLSLHENIMIDNKCSRDRIEFPMLIIP